MDLKKSENLVNDSLSISDATSTNIQKKTNLNKGEYYEELLVT